MWTQESEGKAPVRTGAQSIERAVALLQIIASGRDTGLGLSNLVKLSGLTRPTVHRMVTALVSAGLVEQRPRSRRYAIGEQIQLLAMARSRRPLLLSGTEEKLKRAAEDLGDTVLLTVRSGADTVCLARHLGSFPIQVLALEVGERRAIGVGSAGIAILACLEHDEAVAILEQNAARLSHYGWPMARLLEEVAASRECGYALRAPGLIRETAALSAPILGPDGAAVGALTLAAIRHRLSPARLPTVVPLLQKHAQAIQRELA